MQVSGTCYGMLDRMVGRQSFDTEFYTLCENDRGFLFFKNDFQSFVSCSFVIALRIAVSVIGDQLPPQFVRKS